jgi:nitrogen fixation protein NifU and related proteins
MSDLAQLYQATILDHHKHPRGAGRLPDATHAAEGHNPLCGDRLTITARIAGGCVQAVRCDATACAICRASGSLLTEAVSGRSVVEAGLLLERLLGALASDPANAGEADWGPLAPLLHVRHFPGRQRCVTLAWETLRRALSPP